jgi:hypothetical protein
MIIDLITKNDLEEMKADILSGITSSLLDGKGEWIRSADVKAILNISSGTLQHLRDSGTLPFSKIGGTIYYERNEIKKLFEMNKQS